jgi:phosphoglycerate dehydrogenase-like enzyme
VEPDRRDCVKEPLVVHVGFGPLAPLVDADRLTSVAGRPVDVRAVPYDLGHAEQTRREREPHAPDLAHGELPLDAELRAALADAEVMLTLNAPLELPTLAPRLRWVQAMGSGVGQFVPSDLPAGGITLTNAAGIGAAPIAEWALGRVLSVYKRFDEHAAQQRRHEWVEALGALLEGRTALVVGVGAIGAAVAVRLRAFGVHTIGVKRSYTPGTTDPAVDELIGPADLLATLPRAHVVVVAAPGTAANEGLFDAAAFAAMRRGAVFVNVARGTLVDEDALLDALRSGHLRAAAIDVARQEPLPADSPLWDAPNLAISPHSSASADRYLERVVDLFVDNLGRYTADRPLRNVVDLAAGY